MIFQISPKLSVARDLPQTYRQTVPQTRPLVWLGLIALNHERRDGQAELTWWPFRPIHTEINVAHRDLNPDAVTYRSTNRT